MRLAESSSRSSSTEPSRSIGTSSRRSFCGQRIALEDDRDARAAVDVDGQFGRAGLRARPKLMVGPRLVVALLAQVGHELLELSIDVGLAVVLSGGQAEPLRYRGQRHRRVALGDHRRQRDAGPGLDLHGHLVPGTRLGEVRSRRRPSPADTLIVVDAFEKRRQVVQAGQRKGRPEPLFDPIAQQTFRHADVAAKDDAPHGAGRHEVVAHRDASGRRARPTPPRRRTVRAP